MEFNFLFQYGLFLAKTITLVAAIAAIIILIVSASMRGQPHEKGHISIKKLNDRYDDLLETVKHAVLDHEILKQQEKDRKKEDKQRKKEQKRAAKKQKNKAVSSSEAGEAGESPKKRIYVTDFVGDIRASQTESLRQVITAILSLATPEDEVVIRLESPGGLVHGYGLAASQLSRITERNVPLTVCVDKVAASGGYMMACVANRIVAAPFAIIGSIGVVAQLPNFHRLLKKHDIDYEMLTAGEYKRTLTMFGENTEKGRKKFVEELEDTHVLFKEFIAEHREIVNVDEVSTGEIWFGRRAESKKLIDQIQTSDEYLFSRKDDCDLYEVEYVHKKSLPEKLGVHVEATVDRLVLSWWQKLNSKFFS